MNAKDTNTMEDNVYYGRGCRKQPDNEDNRSRCSEMLCCAKLATFDWSKGLDTVPEAIQEPLMEIRFKNSRKEFFRVSSACQDTLSPGDVAAVEGPLSGYDIGIVSMTGKLATLQYLKRQKRNPYSELKCVLRKARKAEIDKWNQYILQEDEVQVKARKIANDMGLKMKINDIEYQGDGSKITFFYTADDRVDFRQLIKVYAEVFRVRIEMRQIGARQEAMHLGGIGSCGRELCCVTFISNFHSVTTTSAKVQQLALNPQKLAGQCGKLKCCLNFEYEMYQEAAKDFPSTDIHIFTKKGKAYWHKTDVFAGLMYYAYADDPGQLIALTIDNVRKIHEMNARKEFPESLNLYAATSKPSIDADIDIFTDVVGQGDLTRFDKPQAPRNRNPKSNRSPNNRRNSDKQNKAKTTESSERPSESVKPSSESTRHPHKGPRPNSTPKTKEPNSNASTNDARKPSKPKQRNRPPHSNGGSNINNPILKKNTD